jgi:hypothetical protein
MSAKPRNRYVTLALFLCAVIFAGFAVQRFMEIKLTGSLEEPAFPEAGDVEADLRAGFNEASGQTRIVMLLSAGLPSSELDVDAVRRLLREDRGAEARILAVWRGGKPMRAQTTRFGDGRVRQFWDPERRILPGTLEGTVLVYPAGVTWSGAAMPEAAAQGEPARASLPLLRRALGGGR